MNFINKLALLCFVVFLTLISSITFAEDWQYDSAHDQIYTSTGNVGIGTDNPQSKLHVNGGIKVDGAIKANRHLTHMQWQQAGPSNWTHGYLKLKTPINQYENNLFSIKIIGNRYGSGGTPVEIRCNGYAYCNTGLIQTDCHTEGTNDPVGIGIENDMVIITIGSVDAKRWCYDHFTVEYSGLIKKEEEGFTWEFVPDALPPTTNTNNVYVDDSTGTITTTGNVGIGTTNPYAKLAVIGDGLGSMENPHLKWGYSGYFHSWAENGGLNLLGYVGDGAGWDMYIGMRGGMSSHGKIIFRTGKSSTYSDRMTIDQCGNVGIGTTSPQSKLAVNGTITATEVKVTTDGWSDFVFEENYKLPSLDHVENYIKENKHLQDVPSAEQIAQDGLSMSEMMAKQMQKIEELTLYMIELKKENESLKTQVDQINEIKARLAAIEGK